MPQVHIGHDLPVFQWVNDRFPGFNLGDFNSGVKATLSVWREGVLEAGMIFSNYRGFEVELTIAAKSPRWATRDVLRAIFHVAFVQLGCVRFMVKIAKNNKRARKLAEGVGFQYEGKLRNGYDGLKDAIVYGMLSRECRFLH